MKGLEKGKAEGQKEERTIRLDSFARQVKAGKMRAEDVAAGFGIPVEQVNAAVAKIDGSL